MWVGISEKALNDYAKQKEQKKVVIRYKTKVYTEVRYFAMTIGRKLY